MTKFAAGKSFVIATLLLTGGTAAAQEPPEGEEEAVDGSMAPPEETPPPEEVTTTSAEPGGPVTEEEPVAEAAAASLAPKLSGFVYGTYNYNVMAPSGGSTPFHSFTARDNTFLLNAAHVAITGSDDKLSYVFKIHAGTDSITMTGGSLFETHEAYLAYTGESGMGFKVGKFVTTQGIEVIESPANPTISRGFLFGLAEPYGHVGALFTYKVSDTLDVAAGLVNGWDLMVDNNDMKTFMGKVGFSQDKLAITGTLYAGPEQADNEDDYRISADVTGVLKGDAMDLWFQANGGNEGGDAGGSWFGAGVQPVYRMSDELSIGARAEVFLDLDGARSAASAGVAGLVDGVTLVTVGAAPALKVHDNVTLRAEARLDFATEDVLGDGDAIQVVGLSEAIVTF